MKNVAYIGLAFLMAIYGPSAIAQTSPSVFVSTGDDGRAWWIGDFKMRPLANNPSPISAALINQARKEQGYLAPTCYMELLTKQSITALDRKLQTEILDTWNKIDSPFEGQITLAGKTFTMRSGIFEECDGGAKGSFIVVTDSAGVIRDYGQWTWDETWSGLMFIRRKQNNLVRSSCLYCDDDNVLYYDSARNKLYWEYEGH